VLTQRHCGRNQQEAARLKQLACRCTELGKTDGYLTVMSGPLAGYELSVTRALGHKHMQQYGIIPVPYVCSVDLTPDDLVLVGGAARDCRRRGCGRERAGCMSLPSPPLSSIPAPRAHALAARQAQQRRGWCGGSGRPPPRPNPTQPHSTPTRRVRRCWPVTASGT
jgi:hypothetical protein